MKTYYHARPEAPQPATQQFAAAAAVHYTEFPIRWCMMRRHLTTRIGLLALLALAFAYPTASASAITLSYVGNPFQDVHFEGTLPPDVYTTSDRVNGFIELAAPLGANLAAGFVTPVSFSFSDGINTLTNSNTTLTSFEFWTDASGQIVNWAVNLFDFNPGVFRSTVQTLNFPGFLGCGNCEVDAGQSVLCGPVVDCIDASGSLNIAPLYAQQARVDALPGVWMTVATPVALDIKPGGFPNSINPTSKGVIPVAILTTPTFDATTVDPLSVRFGPNGATDAHGQGHIIEDADGDGDLDLVLHFRTQNTGIQCRNTSASLTGTTFTGQTIQGTDSVQTVGCR